MAIYVSRKNRVVNREEQEAREVFLINVRARLWLEFRFYQSIGNLEAFKDCWCWEGLLCSVVEELHFARFLME